MQEKRGPGWFLMVPSFVPRKRESKPPGEETKKRPSQKKRPSCKNPMGPLGADRDRGIEIDTDRNTDRERDIDRDRKHRNHW